jgi:hypothetical protein
MVLSSYLSVLSTLAFLRSALFASRPAALLLLRPTRRTAMTQANGHHAIGSAAAANAAKALAISRDFRT